MYVINKKITFDPYAILNSKYGIEVTWQMTCWKIAKLFLYKCENLADDFLIQVKMYCINDEIEWLLSYWWLKQRMVLLEMQGTSIQLILLPWLVLFFYAGKVEKIKSSMYITCTVFTIPNNMRGFGDFMAWERYMHQLSLSHLFSTFRWRSHLMTMPPRPLSTRVRSQLYRITWGNIPRKQMKWTKR